MAKKAKKDGIIILGVPRSGTTLLRRLIDAHPNIACPAETNVFTACGRFLRSERIGDGIGIGVLDGLGYAGFAKDEVLARLREFAFSFHREYAARQGKARWGSKTAFDAFYLDEIEQICGEHASFVCIQRHGLDVACSIRELCDKNGGYLSELLDYVTRYPVVLEAFAHVWVDLTARVRAFVERHPHNSLMVTYEDLTANADQTMAQVCEFLGEEWDPSLLVQALADKGDLGLGDWKTYARSSVDQSSVGRWKGLPRETINRLGAICNPTLASCGYDCIELQPEQSTEEAHRRHRLGLLVQGLKSG